ncbi:hypothetical protein QJS10_CPB14g00156 [Acorus calamus]|uniref:Photosystem I assembly factor PSA3, chloroplastic n=1 Tax=Acorus calamus TaxID=4465 RepID=A0AAV9DD73_ACOCL|nr:hypothetical protein QJS10_CPB14g00156 [Acorus calamus]
MASWASTPNPLSLLKPNHPLKLHALFLPLNALQRRRGGASVGGGALSSRAYMENPNSLSSFVGRVIGSLPVVGLLARVLSDEGGVGGDIIDFAEFRRRVGKKCGVTDSRAFYEFRDRRGRAGDPLYVLMCCWLAAVGAGLLKSEEILEGVARLRISDDIEFEEENFLSLMNDTKERRAKLKSANPEIPMEIRAAKALEAIHVCCFGKGPIEDEDVRLLRVILNAVFPSVGQSKIDEMVDTKAKQVAEEERTGAPEEEKKPLSKEAVDLQLKDLQFLKQNSENLKA